LSESKIEKEQKLILDAKKYMVQRWEPRPYHKPLVMVKGDGAYFWDMKGKRYLDLVAQLFNVHAGLNNREIIEAAKKQLDDLAYASPNYYTEPTIQLAKRLVEIAPGKNYGKVFFGNSGTEANEAAIKMAQMFRQAPKLIGFWDAYHGSTLASVSIGGAARNRTIPGLTLFEEYKHVPSPYCYRCVFKQTYPECDLACAEFIRYTIEKEGDKTVAAFLAEPICSWAGQIVPPKEYWPRVRKILDEKEVLLIFDEVMTGFCQTGKMFAPEHWNVEPDIETFAKGISSGYIPLGATLVNNKLADYFDEKGFAHSFTYSGHSTACAAGLACVEYYIKNNLADNAAKVGKYVLDELEGMQERTQIIGDIRSLGLFIGMELVANTETKEMILAKDLDKEKKKDPEFNPVLWINEKMKEKGVIIGASPGTGIIRMMPMVAITKEQMGEGLKVLEETIEEAKKKFNLPKK
jgi:taurine--2-oxoglutarate transaminase